MMGCLQTRVRKQPIIALYFEFENELKFYNLGTSALPTEQWCSPSTGCTPIYQHPGDFQSVQLSPPTVEQRRARLVCWICSVSVTLFILIDYLIHIDTISMELFILYFKGLPVKISIK